MIASALRSLIRSRVAARIRSMPLLEERLGLARREDTGCRGSPCGPLPDRAPARLDAASREVEGPLIPGRRVEGASRRAAEFDSLFFTRRCTRESLCRTALSRVPRVDRSTVPCRGEPTERVGALCRGEPIDGVRVFEGDRRSMMRFIRDSLRERDGIDEDDLGTAELEDRLGGVIVLDEEDRDGVVLRDDSPIRLKMLCERGDIEDRVLDDGVRLGVGFVRDGRE